MKPLCVLIALDSPLLAQSVGEMFRADGQLQVVHSQASDLPGLRHALAEHKPEVMLLSNRLAHDATIASLLNKLPTLQLIVINEENNWAQVFQKKNILLTQAPDLLQLVHAL